MNRRTFNRTALGSLLAGPAAKMVHGVPQRSVTATAQPNDIKISNSTLELVFDWASGALASIANNSLGRTLPIGLNAAAPVRLWLGTREEPDQVVVAIARSNPRSHETEVLNTGPNRSLVHRWRNLIQAGAPTGIELTQTYTLSPNDDFVRIRTAVQNRGPRWVTGLFLGLEGVVLDTDPKREVLMAGTTGPGAWPVVDPRNNLPAGTLIVKYPANRRSFSVPPTHPQALIATWMDFSHPGGGIGTGYLDRDMDLVGDIQALPDGLTIGWRLFRLEGSRGFLGQLSEPRLIYPLAPGEQFTSDEWILSFHEGDWHQTADTYRRRYEISFRGDFLDWEATSPAVRSADVVFNERIAWGNPSSDPSRAYDYPDGHVIHRFDQIPGLMEEAIRLLGVQPSHTIVFALGTGPHWGIYRMPDHFPMNEAAGGQAAAEKMVRDLEQMGVAAVCCYAHPYFMHRDAKNHIAAASTGWNYPHRDWHTSMGGLACLGVEKWQQLWTREIFPRYREMGVRGLYFDEGYGHQVICPRPNHDHGSSSLSLLTAQSTGAQRLYRAFRSTAGPGAFLSCEAGSDVQARFVDLWHLNPSESIRYTHPDRMMLTNIAPKRLTESVAQALLFGCPILVMPFPEGQGSALQGELLDALRSFVALRQELREKKAPGYPQRFRDNIGVSISPQGLRAKVFADTGGVTVVYFAPEAFEGSVSIDGQPLGVARLGTKRLQVKLAAKRMGYEILRVS